MQTPIRRFGDSEMTACALTAVLGPQSPGSRLPGPDSSLQANDNPRPTSRRNMLTSSHAARPLRIRTTAGKSSYADILSQPDRQGRAINSKQNKHKQGGSSRQAQTGSSSKTDSNVLCLVEDKKKRRQLLALVPVNMVMTE